MVLMAESNIGSKIATLRESHGLSVAELAERCDCDAATIESLEAGALAPSLAPLIKITRALGVRLGTLLDDEQSMGPVVTRKGDAATVTRFKGAGTGGEAGALDFASLAGDKASKHMEPFLIDAHPGSADGHLSTHEGEEFIFVIEGVVEIEYGKEVYRLEPGDSIYYDSIVPHQLRAHGDVPARILAVVYAPA